MNTISMTGQVLATDGLYRGATVAMQRQSGAGSVRVEKPGDFPNSAAEVVESLSQNLEEFKDDAAAMQKLSDFLKCHTLQFDINKELGKVIIKVVDPSTKQIVREIPSEDLQKLQAHLKDAVGVLFDENV